jgi:hypothetical protein
VADSCEHDKELSGSMKGGEILEWLNCFIIILSGVRLSPLGTAATIDWPILPAPNDRRW